MNNNLSTQALVHKTKEELWKMIVEATEYGEFGDEDEMYSALEQIESVTYVLRNCEYKGREN